MKAKCIFFLTVIVCIGMIGCRTQHSIPVESSKMDSISQNSEILTQRVQTLLNEIRVLEQRRDSVSVHDSVAITDSVVVHINEAGDVVSKERYRDRIQKSDRTTSSENNKTTEITRQYIDSLLTEQKTEMMALIEESNQMPIPVERQLSKWEQLKQDVGSIAIGIFVVVLVVAVIWLIKKVKNQR